VLVILAGCGGSSPFSASERDDYNRLLRETIDRVRVASKTWTFDRWRAVASELVSLSPEV